MVQTAANNLTEDQYLQIVNEASTHAGNLSRGNEVELPAIQNVLFKKVSPLYYKTRVRLSFSLTDEFKSHFALVRGLIEFYRSKSFSFEYNAVQKGIETDIEASQLRNLQVFFESILSWLKKELKFKETLKVILEFENRYKLEQEEVYALFTNVTSGIKNR
jgi:hypothetical protein